MPLLRTLPALINWTDFLPCPKGLLLCINPRPILSFFQYTLQDDGIKYLFSHSVSPCILAAAWVPVILRIWYVSFKSYKLICWFFCQKRCSKDTWSGISEKYFRMCTSKNVFIPTEHVFGAVVYLTEIKYGPSFNLQKDFFFFKRLKLIKQLLQIIILLLNPK